MKSFRIEPFILGLCKCKTHTEHTATAQGSAPVSHDKPPTSWTIQRWVALGVKSHISTDIQGIAPDFWTYQYSFSNPDSLNPNKFRMANGAVFKVCTSKPLARPKLLHLQYRVEWNVGKVSLQHFSTYFFRKPHQLLTNLQILPPTDDILIAIIAPLRPLPSICQVPWPPERDPPQDHRSPSIRRH